MGLAVCVRAHMCKQGRGGRPGEQPGNETGKAGRHQIMKHLTWHVKVLKPDSEVIGGFFCKQQTLLQLYLATFFTFPNQKFLIPYSNTFYPIRQAGNTIGKEVCF